MGQYDGISWNEEKKRWQVEFDFNGKKCKYYFENKFDAIKARNRIHKKMEITPQNPETINQQKNEKKSQYKGVYWHTDNRKWRVMLRFNGQKQTYGGMFKEELDAAKKATQLCEEFGIQQQKPTISVMTNQKFQKKEKTSQYKGVYWHKTMRKWRARLCLKEGKLKCGGDFQDELDAGKRVNQLCEEMGIPLQNPEISAIPNQQYQKKEKTSQYKGVYWHKQKKRWCAWLTLKNGKKKYGGNFKDELDAAKKVNQLCGELEIPVRNPEISAIPDQRYQRKKEKIS